MNQFDYYFSWIICPLSVVAFTWTFYAFTKQNNNPARICCLAFCFLWAANFIVTLKNILTHE